MAVPKRPMDFCRDLLSTIPGDYYFKGLRLTGCGVRGLVTEGSRILGGSFFWGRGISECLEDVGIEKNECPSSFK